MADCIRLYYDDRLMNTITSGSKWKTIPNARCDTDEGRERVANELIEGWVRNASYDRQKFRIERGKTDQIVLSNMTQEIIRKSRENIGT